MIINPNNKQIQTHKKKEIRTKRKLEKMKIKDKISLN